VWPLSRIWVILHLNCTGGDRLILCEFLLLLRPLCATTFPACPYQNLLAAGPPASPGLPALVSGDSHFNYVSDCRGFSAGLSALYWCLLNASNTPEAAHLIEDFLRYQSPRPGQMLRSSFSVRRVSGLEPWERGCQRQMGRERAAWWPPHGARTTGDRGNTCRDSVQRSHGCRRAFGHCGNRVSDFHRPCTSCRRWQGRVASSRPHGSRQPSRASSRPCSLGPSMPGQTVTRVPGLYLF